MAEWGRPSAGFHPNPTRRADQQSAVIHLDDLHRRSSGSLVLISAPAVHGAWPESRLKKQSQALGNLPAAWRRRGLMDSLASAPHAYGRAQQLVSRMAMSTSHHHSISV